MSHFCPSCNEPIGLTAFEARITDLEAKLKQAINEASDEHCKGAETSRLYAEQEVGIAKLLLRNAKLLAACEDARGYLLCLDECGLPKSLMSQLGAAIAAAKEGI